MVWDVLGERKQLRVLDLGCGTGNDFPYFLKHHWTVLGIDQSPGMLNLAAKNYGEQVRLVQMDIREVNADKLAGEKFDLIFSITGGFAYMNDEDYRLCLENLNGLMAPNGVMVLAHLTRFSLGDAVLNFLKLKWKRIPLRFRPVLQVPIKGETYSMHLRTAKQLKSIVVKGLTLTSLKPLLALTPPYQTGLQTGPISYKVFRALERLSIKLGLGTRCCDQLVTIYRKEK